LKKNTKKRKGKQKKVGQIQALLNSGKGKRIKSKKEKRRKGG
jgi:hypothetical protein